MNLNTIDRSASKNTSTNHIKKRQKRSNIQFYDTVLDYLFDNKLITYYEYEAGILFIDLYNANHDIYTCSISKIYNWHNTGRSVHDKSHLVQEEMYCIIVKELKLYKCLGLIIDICVCNKVPVVNYSVINKLRSGLRIIDATAHDKYRPVN